MFYAYRRSIGNDWRPGKLRFNLTLGHGESSSAVFKMNMGAEKWKRIAAVKEGRRNRRRRRGRRRRRRRRNDVHLARLSGEERFLRDPKDLYLLSLKRPVCYGTLSAHAHTIRISFILSRPVCAINGRAYILCHFLSFSLSLSLSLVLSLSLSLSLVLSCIFFYCFLEVRGCPFDKVVSKIYMCILYAYKPHLIIIELFAHITEHGVEGRNSRKGREGVSE